MTYIETKNLSYSYPLENKKALSNISLKVNKGEILLVLGGSGSGKSTLAKCITGTIPNFYGGIISGEITINGKNIREFEHREMAKEITMVFQDPERQLVMNKVHREIAFGLENIGINSLEIKRRVWESLQFSNTMDLAFRDTDSLSGGQKQRIAITSAIAYTPECIVFDEPTSQLDPAAAEEVLSLIKKINDELGTTVVIIEQRLDRWVDVADKIIVLKDGCQSFFGTKEELYNTKEEKNYGYLPIYLKLAKMLRFNKMPRNFKETRALLNNSDVTFEQFENKSIQGTSIINASGLSCRYDDIEALKDLNFSINSGEFVALLGANGAGKSTLLKSIVGLMKYSGKLIVGDKEVKRTKLKELAKTVGYVSQNPNDYISKNTVLEEVKFTLDNYEIADNGIIEETLKALDIWKLRDKNPRDLSGGERQRVAIASILVLKPKILLLDEPTRGLDSNVKIALGETLKKLNNMGSTIVLVTHDVEFAAEFCSRFMLMFNGEIVADGDRKNVLSNSIYYTTAVNKLMRDIDDGVFLLKEISVSKEVEYEEV